ncbi:uncharacterized protein LAESUDRAFT_715697 [Laetiporus sulphureus 93-53]|uniref:Uncharacterized protein n=1 Tax=Laetiporus sulphureus 93-53 TaxID=1314785 RepID=A0A165D4H6_9APHY|nr:uncharacterized protein LAESUDRAFT_715697 [Laetiporus sulphureus 93-53]KZT04140.1 hypothetical protein LAESUDRAFT_715697 [Laetiporus sulphureus 93-53]
MDGFLLRLPLCNDNIRYASRTHLPEMALHPQLSTPDWSPSSTTVLADTGPRLLEHYGIPFLRYHQILWLSLSRYRSPTGGSILFDRCRLLVTCKRYRSLSITMIVSSTNSGLHIHVTAPRDDSPFRQPAAHPCVVLMTIPYEQPIAASAVAGRPNSVIQQAFVLTALDQGCGMLREFRMQNVEVLSVQAASLLWPIFGDDVRILSTQVCDLRVLDEIKWMAARRGNPAAVARLGWKSFSPKRKGVYARNAATNGRQIFCATGASAAAGCLSVSRILQMRQSTKS